MEPGHSLNGNAHRRAKGDSADPSWQSTLMRPIGRDRTHEGSARWKGRRIFLPGRLTRNRLSYADERC